MFIDGWFIIVLLENCDAPIECEVHCCGRNVGSIYCKMCIYGMYDIIMLGNDHIFYRKFNAYIIMATEQ